MGPILLILFISIPHAFGPHVKTCDEKQYKCSDGACVKEEYRCDGHRDCADDSDELGCEGRSVIALLKPPHGKCVLPPPPFSATYQTNIADAEVDKPYDRLVINLSCKEGYILEGSSTVTCEKGTWSGKWPKCLRKREQKTNTRGRGNCVLPPYPEHGSYVAIPGGEPGERYENVAIRVSCDEGYMLETKPLKSHAYAYCDDGKWPKSVPKCVPHCYLEPDPSVEYYCQNDIVEMPCEGLQPSGTTVRPRCRDPEYYAPTTLKDMHCIDGAWDYVAICRSECGLEALPGEDTKTNLKVPWHAGIYTKREDQASHYDQICGGTLISTAIVITAAHCFWRDDGPQIDSNYAVAVGKLYRSWDDPRDEYVQKSDELEFFFPKHFRGAATNFQNNIAIVRVIEEFVFTLAVRPVCLDFDIFFFEKQQLQGKQTAGMMAGWGLVSENGKSSKTLKTMSLAYVDIDTCFEASPATLQKYITGDKMCAAVYKGSNPVCVGDSGGGLYFPETKAGVTRYYLRGVASTAPQGDNLCTLDSYILFTQISKFEYLIKPFVDGNMTTNDKLYPIMNIESFSVYDV